MAIWVLHGTAGPAPPSVGITVPSGLVGYWPLDTATTSAPNTTDIVGGQTGTMTGTPSLVTGKVAEGLSLDGSTQYVRCGNGAYLPTWSVCAWINPTDFSGYNIVAMRGDNSNQNYYIDTRITSGLVNVTFTDGVGSFRSVNSLAAVGAGVWGHVVGTFDGSTLRVYINGALDNSAAAAFTPDNSNGIGIGTYGATSTANAFKGAVDDIRVYDHAISGAEVTSIYNAGLAGHR